MNENPQEFKNVKVYSSDPWNEAADALYKNLIFENIEGQPASIIKEISKTHLYH